MAKIDVTDWKTWKSANPSQNRGVKDYLHDDKKVIGEWQRVFQYLVLPSRPATIRAYDVFVDEPSMQWELNYNPNSVKLIRCQVKNGFLHSTPNFEYKIVNLPVDAFRKICEDLEAIEMPRVFSKLRYQSGFDGAHYQFEFNSPVLRLRYHWWSIPTEEIRALADYCHKLAQIFETYLGQVTKYE